MSPARAGLRRGQTDGRRSHARWSGTWTPADELEFNFTCSPESQTGVWRVGGVQVSAREFVAFVLAAGATRPGVIRRIAAQRARPFDPQGDYWLPLRVVVQQYFRNGAGDAGPLQRVVESVAHDRVPRYRRAVEGILRYRGRWTIGWIEPPQLRWSHSGLVVTCAPDLGLIDRGSRSLVRLYYDDTSPSRSFVSAHAELLRLARGGGQPGLAFGVLDVDRARLRTSEHSVRWVEALEQEAESFMSYWNRRRSSQQQTA